MASSLSNERVFLIGASGNIGKVVIRGLAEKNIPITLYARNMENAAAEFSYLKGDDAKFTIVQGGADYSDLAPLKAALPGHTRLFLLVNNPVNMPNDKKEIARAAFAAGVKQIVDISCALIGTEWRQNYISYLHKLGEDAILSLPDRGYVVSLRPSRFMSNLLNHYRPGPEHVEDFVPADTPQAWVSPTDIGDIAAVILSDPDFSKHGDSAYEIVSDVVTPAQLADILTRTSGRPISYKQVTPLERFESLKLTVPFFPFRFIYDLACMNEVNPQITSGIPILLGREPQSLESFLFDNKDALKL